nr:hypothetical protein [Tanacetum cinerariifolium]
MADGSLKMYLLFSHILKDFNREYVETLWKLVKAKHGSTRPEEDYERVLWGDLKVMFDPHVEDEVWKMQQRYSVMRWTLFNSYGVHYIKLVMLVNFKKNRLSSYYYQYKAVTAAQDEVSAAQEFQINILKVKTVSTKLILLGKVKTVQGNTLSENSPTLPKTQVVEGVTTFMPIISVEDKAQRRLEDKARNTLIMGITNEHQLKFNYIKDAKQLMEAIEKRFVLNKDLEQIHPDDLEEIDLKWKMAMLTMRDKRWCQPIWCPCYWCGTRGHFTRECIGPRSQDTKNKESIRRNAPVETPALTTLVSCDGLGGYDWSDQAEEGLDEFANKPVVENYDAKTSETKPKNVRKNTNAPIIKEWVSDDEGEEMIQPKFEQKTIKPSIPKIEFVKPMQPEKKARKTVKHVDKPRKNT